MPQNGIPGYHIISRGDAAVVIDTLSNEAMDELVALSHTEQDPMRVWKDLSNGRIPEAYRHFFASVIDPPPVLDVNVLAEGDEEYVEAVGAEGDPVHLATALMNGEHGTLDQEVLTGCHDPDTTIMRAIAPSLGDYEELPCYAGPRIAFPSGHGYVPSVEAREGETFTPLFSLEGGPSPTYAAVASHGFCVVGKDRDLIAEVANDGWRTQQQEFLPPELSWALITRSGTMIEVPYYKVWSTVWIPDFNTQRPAQYREILLRLARRKLSSQPGEWKEGDLQVMRVDAPGFTHRTVLE